MDNQDETKDVHSLSLSCITYLKESPIDNQDERKDVAPNGPLDSAGLIKHVDALNPGVTGGNTEESSHGPVEPAE